jgi:signal transduction histidine kinase
VITDESEAMQHLAALERLEHIIAAFASMVSHQTRTALVGIQGLSELIMEGELTRDEVRACASDIFSEAQRVDAMIGEMFDLNRLETRQSSFRQVDVDLNEVVREAVGRLHANLEVDVDLPVVHGDPDRLRQALQKFFSFVQRSSAGGSRIDVTTRRRSAAAHLSVRSSSSRVVDLEDWLYGRYERYEQRPSAIMGAGLGLAIARAIIELHGGRITVHLPPGGGAEFDIMLPAPEVSAAEPEPVTEPPPSR